MIDANRWGRGVRSEKFGHKNATKHEKGDPPRFSDNPKYSPEKNLVNNQRPLPPEFPHTVHLWNGSSLNWTLSKSDLIEELVEDST